MIKKKNWLIRKKSIKGHTKSYFENGFAKFVKCKAKKKMWQKWLTFSKSDIIGGAPPSLGTKPVNRSLQKMACDM